LSSLRHDYYGANSQSFFEYAYELLQILDAPLRNQPFNDNMAAYTDIVRQSRSLVYNDAAGRVF
jgi:hypothetical protein